MQFLSPAMTITFALVAGWLAGGFANLAADVLPDFRADADCMKVGAKDSRRHARCRAPIHHLALSWCLLQNGVCPRCGRVRTARAPLLQLATALAFVLIWARLGQQPVQATLICMYAAFLLAVLVIDIEHRLVLNVMLAPAAVVAMVASLLAGGPTPMQALTGGLIAFAAFFLLAVVGRGALGFGDVKLAGVIGLMAGYPAVIGALFTGIIFGGIGAVVLIAMRKATRKSSIAYAPYLVLGALVAILIRGPIS